MMPFVVVMKIEIETQYGNKQRKTAPSAPGEGREGLPRVSGRGCDGEVASTERIHGQGSSPGSQSRRHLQNVVHQFHDRQRPLLRRNVSGTEAKRAHSLQQQVRRSEP